MSDDENWFNGDPSIETYLNLAIHLCEHHDNVLDYLDDIDNDIKEFLKNNL